MADKTGWENGTETVFPSRFLFFRRPVAALSVLPRGCAVAAVCASVSAKRRPSEMP
ncbi:hypothetical protein [Kingella potus]|uniref:hypothetical protein n=1 Tax=Kingella potus TaxID=265175 RepID=UPI001FD61210|nr:hypothetical protein [Kingella potus]UOP01477.1 hypothetical protein LVJ84_04600 [Kingella potus]